MIELPSQVRIQQRVVTLAAAPQHIVLATQAVRGLQAAAHLRRGPGKHLRVRAGGGAAGIARVAEQICGAPQELHARRSHLRRHALLDLLQVVGVLFERRGRRHRIHIVEGEIRHAQALEEIEGGLELGVRHFLGDGRAEPRTRQRAAAENIRDRAS